MLGDVSRVLAQSLLQSLHKVHQILHRVLLIANGTRVAGVIYNVIEDFGGVHVALISVEKSGEEVLQLVRHLQTKVHPLGFHLQLLIHFSGSLLLLRPSDSVCENLFAHVRQEKEGLDKGVEVASVSNVLEADRHTFLSLSLVQSQRLSFQARLDCVH